MLEITAKGLSELVDDEVAYVFSWNIISGKQGKWILSKAVCFSAPVEGNMVTIKKTGTSISIIGVPHEIVNQELIEVRQTVSGMAENEVGYIIPWAVRRHGICYVDAGLGVSQDCSGTYTVKVQKRGRVIHILRQSGLADVKVTDWHLLPDGIVQVVFD